MYINNTIIEGTEAFKELDVVTQQIYKKKKMMDEVRHGFQVAKNVGIEKYDQTFYPRPYLLKVVKELITKFENKN